jgi:hypothetical protein
LGFAYKLSEKVNANLLFESNDKTLTSGRFGFFIKLANVELKNIIPNSSLHFGIIPTISFTISEKLWNYRSVEKTITDMRGFTSGSDLGISLRGTFDKAGNYGYGLMIANGNYQRPETSKHKRFYGDLFFKPVKGIVVDLYADFENGYDDKNKLLYKGTLAYQHERFTFGVEGFQQIQFKAVQDSLGVKSDIKPLGISAFAWGNIIGSKPEQYPKVNLFARFDLFDPNTELDTLGFSENFLTGGIDIEPYKDVHIMPNIWVNSYNDKSSIDFERKADVVGRLTFFYLYR